jgi:hypothetical protein
MSENLISEGSYMAKALPPRETIFIKAGTGSAGVHLMFQLIDDGPFKGREIEWSGWLTDKTKERTAESLTICGFDGDDEQTVTRNVVQLVIEHESNVSEKSGKTYVNARVKWINDPSRSRTQFTPMDEASRLQAKATLRGLVLASKEARSKSAPPGDASSFNYGANAPVGGKPDPAVKF